MTERERLTELLYHHKLGFIKVEDLADYLIANGVIVPPCKVGDKIYRAVYDWEGCKTVSEWELEKLEVYVDEVGFVDDSDNWIAFDDFGKTVFLTREEAEQALRKEEEGK